jgi:hypothetical protein
MPRGSPPTSPDGAVWFGGHPHSATLCLRFCDDNLDPDLVTSLMRRTPSRSRRKGQAVLETSVERHLKMFSLERLDTEYDIVIRPSAVLSVLFCSNPAI